MCGFHTRAINHAAGIIHPRPPRLLHARCNGARGDGLHVLRMLLHAAPCIAVESAPPSSLARACVRPRSAARGAAHDVCRTARKKSCPMVCGDSTVHVMWRRFWYITRIKVILCLLRSVCGLPAPTTTTALGGAFSHVIADNSSFTKLVSFRIARSKTALFLTSIQYFADPN